MLSRTPASPARCSTLHTRPARRFATGVPRMSSRSLSSAAAAADCLRGWPAHYDEKTFPRFLQSGRTIWGSVARCAETAIADGFWIKKPLLQSVPRFHRTPLEIDALLREIRIIDLSLIHVSELDQPSPSPSGRDRSRQFCARIEPMNRSTFELFAIAAALPHTLWCFHARGRDWRWLAVRGLFGERGCFPLGRFASLSSSQADFAGDSLSQTKDST